MEHPLNMIKPFVVVKEKRILSYVDGNGLSELEASTMIVTKGGNL